MILEVKHLQLVESLAVHGTLTNAGKHLNLTQSALSHQLVELERRLGTPLFHRVGRRLVPTIAGDRLLRPIEALLAGRIDVGIVSRVVPDVRFDFAPLFDDELVLITAPSHRLVTRPHVTAQDFADEHLIVYTEPGSTTMCFGASSIRPA